MVERIGPDSGGPLRPDREEIMAKWRGPDSGGAITAR